MKYIKLENLPTNIVAFTTTKELGNTAYQVSDNKDEVKKIREQIAEDFNFKMNDFIFTYQYHSTTICKVNKTHKGLGAFSFESGVRADALYTKDYNTPIGVFHADCVPVFIYAPSIPLVGIIHAGKPGSINEITFKSLLALITNEGIDPRDIRLHIGPSLRQEKEIINEEEIHYLKMHGYDNCLKDNKLDKALLNVEQALRLGVLKENITVSDLDTYDNELTYSASNQEKEVGRMASIIYLKS